MKGLFFCSLFIIKLSFCSGQICKNDRIIISSVNLFTETPYDISCDVFLSSFKSTMISKEVVAAGVIQDFRFFFKKIKYAKKNRGIDTRAKFIYTDGVDNKDIIICMNLFDIIIDGKLIKRNSQFHEFLKGLLPPENISYPNGGKTVKFLVTTGSPER